MRTFDLRQIAYVAIASLSLGCGAIPTEENRKDPANGTGKIKDWAFTVALSKQNPTVVQGTTDTTIITITRTGGFTGKVTLTSMAPPGNTFSVVFEDITSTGTVTTARMLTIVPASFPPFNGIIFGLVATPALGEVPDFSTTVSFSVVRKPGTFTNVVGTATVGRGQSVSLRVSLIRTNYDAPVPMNLAVGTITGITAVFSPNPVIDTVTQMTISVDASVADGVYNVGVRANEGNPFQGTAPLLLTVTAPGTVGLSFTVPVLTVLRGSPLSTALNVARNNYVGPVFFTATGLPAGATATCAPSTSGPSASCSFSSGNAPAGDYVVTVTGSAPGLAPATATLTLRITG